MKWRPFKPKNGPAIDLSYLDAHEVIYSHSVAGKETVTYKFWVTYSMHCFAKDYEHLSPDESEALMYRGPKESRPFCHERYNLSRTHLRSIIEGLGTNKVKVHHAGYGGYAAAPMLDQDGKKGWYFVSFKIYSERKKYRLHVTSAYWTPDKPGGKVGFFTILENLRNGKPLPKPQK